MRHSIYVSNLELAKQFYCGKLGFELSREYDANTVSLKHEGIPIVLYQVRQAAEPGYPRQAQVVIGLETDNLAVTIAKLTAQGIEAVYDAPQPCPPGVYNAIRDPFGNVIELLEFSKPPSGH
ncbi:VOC family protein [Paenibacillus dendritiformis]|uniref:VOC family protein n=1 Tax=Paenibacillus dendritiformis TaxID=130049 RepID=UPI001F54F106|nr:VOC family protein [Paenibacillus dendritiformis]